MLGTDRPSSNKAYFIKEFMLGMLFNKVSQFSVLTLFTYLMLLAKSLFSLRWDFEECHHPASISRAGAGAVGNHQQGRDQSSHCWPGPWPWAPSPCGVLPCSTTHTHMCWWTLSLRKAENSLLSVCCQKVLLCLNQTIPRERVGSDRLKFRAPKIENNSFQ